MAAFLGALLGGLVLFLLGNGLFKWMSSPYFPLSHMIGIALAIAAFVLGPWTALWALNGLAALILVIVAIWENWSLTRHLTL